MIINNIIISQQMRQLTLGDQATAACCCVYEPSVAGHSDASAVH